MDEFENEERQVTVDEYDLLMALEYLDVYAPVSQREDWYKNLSRALDQHLKPKAMAAVKNKPTHH